MNHGTDTPVQQGLSRADAALLASAHRELLTAQASGTQVLGSTAGGELIAAAYAALQRPADELAARRQTRTTRVARMTGQEAA
ncbi:MAG: hypothetical protein ACRDMV_18200 [Streptosporangiales bacterium]